MSASVIQAINFISLTTLPIYFMYFKVLSNIDKHKLYKDLRN